MKFLNIFSIESLIAKDIPFILKKTLDNPYEYITWEDVEKCLNNPALYSFRVIQNSKDLNYKEPQFYRTHWLNHPIVNKGDLFRAVNNGSTLLIENYGFYNQAINNILHEIENKFDVNCAAHVYCGLDNSNSFKIHSDTPSNFILQIEGKTRWRVFKQRSTSLVNISKCNSIIKDSDFSSEDILIDSVMEPGDILYIPARQYHCALPNSPRISISIPCISRENTPRYDRNYFKLNLRD